MRIDIFSDPICPWCYIGRAHLLEASRETGVLVTLAWHPFQLNPDVPAGGFPRAEYRRAKFGSLERSAALDQQVASAGRAAGLAFRFDRMTRTPNTIQAHRLLQYAGAQVQDTVKAGLFRAYFEQGQDIGEDAVLLEVAHACGLERDRVAAFLAGDDLRAAVHEADASARAQGLTAVPSFVVDNRLVFEGAVAITVMSAVLEERSKRDKDTSQKRE